MMNNVVAIQHDNRLLPWQGVTHGDLVEQFLSRRSERTRDAYQADLESFSAFIGTASKSEALQVLIGLGQGRANAIALSYKNSLIEGGLSPSTINRRLSTLRSAIKLANILGLVSWTLSVENERSQQYRDTRGTGEDGYRAMLAEIRNCRNRDKAIRDTAILRLLYDLGLRRGEVVQLKVSSLDIASSKIAIIGKGRSEPESITLPEPTLRAIEDWVIVRGDELGPLFTNFDYARKGKRLTGSSVYRIVKKLGNRVGIKARPHGLRHAAITTAAEITQGNVVAVKRFSRHKNVQTVMTYVDNYKDEGGEIAKQLAGRVQS
jgi:integrase/recombinase XerC